MANISVTHTFTNSTTADATQVNTNFTDIINGTSDGSKDFSISALTCAGNFTANGTTNTLGSASNDDLVINASLASSVPIKTTFTYDIGATAIGLRDVYFGDAGSQARSTKIRANTISASTTLTLPTRSGTVEVVPTFISAQTGTYAILATDDFVPLSGASGAFTATLPTAVGATGKRYFLKRTDATPANVVTIATTSSQTIDGVTTTTLNTQYEQITVISDGSNWHIIERQRSLYIGNETWTDNQTNATTSVYIQRIGARIMVQGIMSFTGAGISDAELTIPAAYTPDATAYASPAGVRNYPIGFAKFIDVGTTYHEGYAMLSGATTIRLVVGNASSTYFSTSGVTSTVPFTWASGDFINFEMSWIVSGWKS